MDRIFKLAESGHIEIKRVHLPDQGLTIEGHFELPPLARLSNRDQLFVAAFVRCHGSIKEMERYLGVSYPTIKSRLKKLAAQLDFVDVKIDTPKDSPLDRLERGEISVSEALREMKS